MTVNAVALSPAAPRQPVHTRAITIQGYLREDGLYDVEAHLVDTKAMALTNLEDRGTIPPGEPLHGMWLRITYDDTLAIRACETVTNHAPFAICVDGGENFSRLVGLSFRPGFLKAANERLGGAQGCTHLRELLQQVATTAIQTTWPARAKRQNADPAADAARRIDSCYAYASDKDVVRRRWPQFYTGAKG